jgi:hypothetical protein
MDGVSFCGNCGAQMEQGSTQASEASRESRQQQSYQQPKQPYGGQSGGGYTYTEPPGGPINGGMVPPKNYMTESIVVTVISFLCCYSPISIVLGIIAIIKANNVNVEFERRNMSEALNNADSAKKLTLWAVIISVIFYIIYAIIICTFLAEAIKESGGLDNLFQDM